MNLPPISKLVLASDNPGKIREVSKIFAGIDIAVMPQSELSIEPAEESGATFVENALLKARHAAGSSGLPALADDSGLVVDALAGRPGVRSARYAGEAATDDANVDKLLEELEDVPDEERGGAFHCAAVLAFADRGLEPLVVEAEWRGRILRERRGRGGFGYDPVFLDPESGKTGAEMSPEEKNRVSHRGRAFRELRNLLEQTRQTRR